MSKLGHPDMLSASYSLLMTFWLCAHIAERRNARPAALQQAQAASSVLGHPPTATKTKRSQSVKAALRNNEDCLYWLRLTWVAVGGVSDH